MEASEEDADGTALFNVGILTRDGQGCERSGAKAAEWFERAIAKNFLPANGALAGLHLDGIGVPQDHSRAHALYKTAESDDVISREMLGRMYWRGQGCRQSYGEARRLLRSAVDESRDPGMEHNLSLLENEIKNVCPLLGEQVVLQGGISAGQRGILIDCCVNQREAYPGSGPGMMIMDLAGHACTVKLENGESVEVKRENCVAA